MFDMVSTMRFLSKFVVLVFFVAPILAPGDALARRSKKTGIIVYSLTQGATIYVDGVRVADVPHEELILLSPGPHSVKVARRGFTERTELIDLRKGQQEELEIDLLPYAGVFTIATNAKEAALWLDSKPFGPMPFDGEIPMGKHVLKVVAEGYLPQERTLEIIGGKSVSMTIDLELAPVITVVKDSSIFKKWWFWTAASVVLAGGVTTAVVLGKKSPEPLPQPNLALTF